MNRLTLCNFEVDETVTEQRADHRLREAPFCPNCVTRRERFPEEERKAMEIVWTQHGDDRHFAPQVQE